jgi:hypothetical protein
VPIFGIIFWTGLLGGGMLVAFGLMALVSAAQRPHWLARALMAVFSALFIGGGSMLVVMAWKLWNTPYGNQP